MVQGIFSKRLALHWQILIAILLAAVIGAVFQALSNHHINDYVLPIFDLGGDIFLRLLTMTVIPLVVTSLFLGVMNIDSQKDLGVIGLRTGLLYVITSLLAITVGLIFVNLIQPGVGANIDLGEAVSKDIGSNGALWELISRIVPKNPFAALAKFDMVAIIFMTLFFAVFTMRVKDEYQSRITSFLEAIYEIVLLAIRAIISLAPIGVFCIVAKLVSTTGLSVFLPLLKYVITVFAALAFHFAVTLPLFLKFLGKKEIIPYFKGMLPALLTAFSSASSAATLPLTMECAHKDNGISQRTTSIVLPLGATVNMDGTALYEGVAVLFIAQVMGVDLSLGSQFVVLITALLVSIGAAGIPHAGLVMMVIILKAVGLPLEATGMIWAVDRVLDMARTATNVWSDSIVCASIDSMVSDREKAT
jgi:proton glutamate symport protein